MRRSFALTLLTLTPLLLAVEEKPAGKPNTLTAREVQDGWLLLFDGETTFGWKVEGEAKVEDGVLVLGGKRETKAEPTAQFAGVSVALEASWQGTKAPSLDPGATGTELAFLADSKERFVPWKADIDTSKPTPPVRTLVPAGSQLRLRSIKVQTRGAQSLFNGKDLSGWKVFRGNPRQERSRWTVRDGILNVKDGPGDLQTEKLFDDFVLQLECRSNGKHLNSGLFFRCLPGKYQQGYEAQIRNQFTEKPTQKYTVEEYDPQTHRLLGKKTILSPAVDFGTGAIYRRMPARKGVARDGEWFTLTIAARGRHLATWVNGIAVVDWTDNRAAHENARNGYRAAAGALSIQGHDPTTDLDFRNLRITALKR